MHEEAYLRGMKRLVGVVQELSLARSMESIQAIVRGAARELTGADGATFVLRDGDQCYYADEDAIAPLWKGLRFPMSVCISGWVMHNRQSAVIKDIYADERIPAEAYRPTFVKSLAMVPIRTSDPIGAIGNYWARERMPTEAEVELLQALADSTSTAMENVQLYSELRDQLEQRTAALHTAQEAEEALRRELEERARTQEALERTEHQLQQSQKMEAVGQLAAGVAHDFNNMLSVILSHSSLALSEMQPDAALREDLEQIYEAGDQAANLTRKLLAFSRQQVMEPRVVDIDEVVSGMENMLQRLIGEDIQLEVRTCGRLAPVLVDPGQIEQVLLNLTVNARDVMPGGGTLRIETGDVRLTEDDGGGESGASPADCVTLTVSDTGAGMDEQTRSRIFDPFFTTKKQGTGLGLSTVYGIVKQSGGDIAVRSAPGRGTTFEISLPAQVGATATTSQPPPEAEQLSGTETILVVEDDDRVRTAACGILRHNGYEVVEAKDVEEALRTCARQGESIDLLLTDVVMPRMSGVQLARRLASEHPGMRVLCMSGYTDEAVLRNGGAGLEFAFLQKPITPQRLLRKLRQVLEQT